MKFKDVVISEASTEAKVAALALLLDKELIKLADTVLNVKKLEGPKGEQGIQGPKGEQGDRGFDGTNGKDGANGKDGKDGEDGKQGVGVADAKIDFDGSLVITLTDGTEINAGDVVPLDTAEKIRVIGNGGGTSQSVLDAIDAINAIISTYGTMATQNANNVAITGGSINGTTIGAAVPASGVFTTLTASALTATGQTSLGGVTGSESFRVYAPSGVTRYLNATGTAAGDANLFADGPVGSTPAVAIYSRSTGLVKLGTAYSSGTSTGTVQFQVSHTASAVNYVQVTGAATGGNPAISAQGSDANTGLGLASKGVAAVALIANTKVQFDVYGGSSVVNYIRAAGANAGAAPSFTALGSDTNIDLNLTTKGTGNLVVSGNGGTHFRVRTDITSSTNFWEAFGSSAEPIFRSTGANCQFQTSTGNMRFMTTTAGAEQLRVAHTASAVNYVQVTGAATGSTPTLSVQGSDADVGMLLQAKGARGFTFQTRGGGTPRTSFVVADSGAASVNYLQAQSNLTGAAPVISALGTDTNIDLALTPKGTGYVKFGTYTATMALTVQGYIEIKDSGGTVRKLAVIA